MRFKTVIQIETDARDKAEAIELVEEYLAGNIVSGVDMRCKTGPSMSKAKVISVVAVSVFLVMGLAIGAFVNIPRGTISVVPGVSAVQPPLKTSSDIKDKAAFKKQWQDRHNKEALDFIKR